jgi:hypothetical protein
MDDDDMAFPDHLERHLKLLEANPGLGFTYSSCIFIRSQPGEKKFIVIGPQGTPDVLEEELFVRVMENVFMGHAAIVVRTSCYKQVGPFDPDLIRCQDYEMVLRLLRAFRCARVSGPTFYVRAHDGLRGTADYPITPKTRRQRIQPFYDRIFLPLRKELTLRDYLPRSWNGRQTEPLDERRAYLQRMSIMASKGLLEEMLEDLASALGNGCDRRDLSDAERAIVRAAMLNADRDDLLFAGPGYLHRIRVLCRGNIGRQVHFELARGITWRFLWALRTCDFAFAFRLVWCASRFVGIRRGVTITFEKLKAKLGLSRGQTR